MTCYCLMKTISATLMESTLMEIKVTKIFHTDMNTPCGLAAHLAHSLCLVWG